MDYIQKTAKELRELGTTIEIQKYFRYLKINYPNGAGIFMQGDVFEHEMNLIKSGINPEDYFIEYFQYNYHKKEKDTKNEKK